MPKLKHKKIVYPIEHSEYHITTPTGVISGIFEDKELALLRFTGRPESWRLLEVTVIKRDVTPYHPKSDALEAVAEELGLNVIDIKVARHG